MVTVAKTFCSSFSRKLRTWQRNWILLGLKLSHVPPLEWETWLNRERRQMLERDPGTSTFLVSVTPFLEGKFCFCWFDEIIYWRTVVLKIIPWPVYWFAFTFTAFSVDPFPSTDNKVGVCLAFAEAWRWWIGSNLLIWRSLRNSVVKCKRSY